MKKTRKEIKKEIKKEASQGIKMIVDEYFDLHGKQDIDIDINISNKKDRFNKAMSEVKDISVFEAMNVLKEALELDEDYAYTWQNNLSLCFYDAYFKANDSNAFSKEEELEIHVIAENAAKDFLEKLKI